jgi:hypothetical protein
MDAAPTRMYRGIGNNVWPSEHGEALFFSTDPARAAAFGELHYVDVTAAEMAKFERPHAKRILEHEPIAANDWRTADPEIIARLKPLEAGRTNDQHDAGQHADPAALARRYDVLRDAAPPEIVRTFDVAAARATEPAAESFDRDAADAAWNDKVAAAGIAHGETPKVKDAAAMANPRPATMDDFYPPAATGEATGPADAGDGTKPPGDALAASDGPEIGGQGMNTVADAAETALEVGDRAAGKILGIFGRAAEAVTGLLTFMFMGGPKQTRQQQRDAAQARGNLETRDAREYAAHVAQREAEHDDRIHAAKTTQQETDLRLAATLGTPATAEANVTESLERRQGLSL